MHGQSHEILMKSDELLGQNVTAGFKIGLISINSLPIRTKGAREATPEEHRNLTNVGVNLIEGTLETVRGSHIVGLS